MSSPTPTTVGPPRPASRPISGAGRQLGRMLVAGVAALLVGQGMEEAQVKDLTVAIEPAVFLLLQPLLAWVGKVARTSGGWKGKVLGWVI